MLLYQCSIWEKLVKNSRSLRGQYPPYKELYLDGTEMPMHLTYRNGVAVRYGKFRALFFI